MVTTDKCIFFYNGIYSQWYPAKFTNTYGTFSCAEQYMMFRKALFFDDAESAAKIMLADNPADQKTLGRKIKNFNADLWNKISYDIVFHGNMCKFSQNPVLFDQLSKTGMRKLVEASPTDKIWGIGMHERQKGIEDESNWQGTNWLGEVITEVREALLITISDYNASIIV
jgi:ribA/ribD-fused uncharacterized protein